MFYIVTLTPPALPDSCSIVSVSGAARGTAICVWPRIDSPMPRINHNVKSLPRGWLVNRPHSLVLMIPVFQRMTIHRCKNAPPETFCVGFGECVNVNFFIQVLIFAPLLYLTYSIVGSDQIKVVI